MVRPRSRPVDPLLIFRHIACEGPGYLAEVLDRHAVPFEVVAVDAGEPVPEAPEASGLVFMGGPMSVNDQLPWVRDELALIRRAAAQGLPLLGHCLGGQLIARALGAGVGPNPVKEIGWFPVIRTPQDSPWLEGLPPEFGAFHWHGETFDPPAGAERLFSSAHCENQGFAVGDRILALQYHVEMTAELVAQWVQVYAAELEAAAGTPTVQQPGRILEDLEPRISGLQGVADVLYGRWLEAVKRQGDAGARPF